VYDSGGVDGDDDGVRGSGVGGGEWCRERADSMLDLLPNSYFELDTIFVSTSGHSSCPISYYLLTTYTTDYCL